MSALIDTLLPRWDVRELHCIDVAAPPDRTWAALERVTVCELPLTRLLMSLRGLGRRTSVPDGTFFDALDFLVPLAEAPGERVAGLIAQPWRLRAGHVQISAAEEFERFDTPGWVRVATDFRVVASGAGSRLSTETRIHGTDDGARRSFARYWRIVRAGSALIRRDVLRAAKLRAEAS